MMNAVIRHPSSKLIAFQQRVLKTPVSPLNIVRLNYFLTSRKSKINCQNCLLDGKFDQRSVRGCLNDPNGMVCKTKGDGCHRCYSDSCNNKPYGQNGGARAQHISFALISTFIFIAATAFLN